MKRSILAFTGAACLCFGLAPPLLASETPSEKVATDASPEGKGMNMKPAETCLTDLRAFDHQLAQDGYWLGGSDYGKGYAIGGRGLGETGFGYDPHFFVDELGRTMAEATVPEKERVSHRGRAFVRLLDALRARSVARG